MQRFTPYLGITAAVLLGVFILALSHTVTVEQSSFGERVASSTLVFVPAVTLPEIAIPNLEPVAATTSVAESPTAKIPTPASKLADAPAPVSATIPAVVPPQSVSNAARLDAAAASLRAALVNILCYVPLQSGLRSVSGSGVIIDTKGTILTNAHIAQYFLLANRGADCTIRTGSPAADRYEASLAYISPTWLRVNATTLTEIQPSGTGEFDFALLSIVRSAMSTTLPDPFSAVPLATLPPGEGTPVVIASYAAQFLQSSQIQSSLFPTIVFGSVKEVFTFMQHSIDVVSLGGSVAAQEGSSGGGVVDASGALVAMITTSTVEGATDTRTLDAITASYIRGAYASETGSPLDLLLEKSPIQNAADYASQLPTLEAIITANLK